MTNKDFDAELYREYDWRFDEVRRLKNLIEREPPTARDDFRKSLLLILYSHFEGYCVFSLQHYLTSINGRGLSCRSVSVALLAGAWERLFNAMDHGDQKCKIFRKSLPHDIRLHRHWRRRHFVECVDEFLASKVELNEDIIDAESNLKPEVLERNLFLLGLDHTFVEQHADTIQKFLGRRNRVAHGEDRRGISESEYNQYESSVFTVCFTLIEFLVEAFQSANYERPTPEYAV